MRYADSGFFAEPGPRGPMTTGRETASPGASEKPASPASSAALPSDPRSARSAWDFLEAKPHFHLLVPTREDRKRRWLALGFSPLLEALGLLLLMWGTAELPRRTRTALENREALLVHLIAPSRQLARPLKPPPAARLARSPIVREPPSLEMRQPVTDRLPAPSIAEAVKVLSTLPPLVTSAFSAPVVPDIPKDKIAGVHTGDFPARDSATTALKLSLPQIQTGAFGDPKGFAGRAPVKTPHNVATLGSFDLPEGSNQGSGSGRTRGSGRVVADAGFGDGVRALGAGGGRAGSEPGRVEQSGFGDAVPQAHVPKAQLPAPTSALEPVVILFKPKPVYPEAARQLRLEGEVALSVVFEASGKVRVRRVVRGLGHGLDEAATRAAEQILFTPARQLGHPVDFEATLRVLFQLAY